MKFPDINVGDVVTIDFTNQYGENVFSGKIQSISQHPNDKQFQFEGYRSFFLKKNGEVWYGADTNTVTKVTVS